MINRILVGIDGSKPSWVAADYGIWLSKRLKRPVVGVHIVDIRLLEGAFLEDLAGFLGFSEYDDLYDKMKEFLDKKGQALLDIFAKKCREEGADCSIAEAFGIPYKELANMADPEDLIIVGKHGHHSKFEEVFVGSTTENLARHAKCPVMVSVDKFKEIKSIYLAFDGREKAVKAAKYLNWFAKALGIDRINAIYIADDACDNKEIEEIQKKLDEVLEIKYDLIVRSGEPAEELERFIKENKEFIDLFVMGAFGKGHIKELILGSTTSYILRTTVVPLLLVK